MTCQFCAAPMTGRKRMYCDRTCGRRAQLEREKADGRRAALRKRQYASRAQWLRDHPVTRQCIACGSDFTVRMGEPTRTCSTTCRGALRPPSPPKEPPPRVFYQGECGWCGDAYLARRLTTYCSRQCGGRAHIHRRDQRRGEFTITKAARRAIYQRDAWTCQLCGDPVDARLDPLDDMAASLDHIVCQSWTDVPDHSEQNLRLAHRICNIRRGNKPSARNLAALAA